MRPLLSRPCGVALAAASLALFLVLLVGRSPDYDALRAQDDVNSGALGDFETIYFAGRPFPVGPMHASPGDHSWLFVLANVAAIGMVSVPSMVIGEMLPWGAAGESWLRALLFTAAASLQWFLLGSIIDAVHQRVVRRS